ncbi:MAG: hypothetical protein VX908_00885 [Planctomycetota bacterium]|nr:hypothetical protein [Planctomycetota bacterium]
MHTRRQARRLIRISTVLALCAVTVSSAMALLLCRYTVRDIGFVSLGEPNWILVIDENNSGLESAGRVLLQDSNVDLETRRLGQDVAGNAWLEDRDGRMLQLPLQPGRSDMQQIESVVRSDARTRIADAALDRFAVILLLEGTDAKANTRAREAMDSAEAMLAELDADGTSLPRRIGKGPDQVIVPVDAGESVLRWSLGLPVEPGRQPSIAVLYGRSKLAGRVLHGPGMTAGDILDQLSVVGLSCECEQARDWALRPSLPGTWTHSYHMAAVDQLGFDPAHPLVLAEVRRILARGNDAPVLTNPGDTSDDLVLGYSESTVIEDIPVSPTAERPEPIAPPPQREPGSQSTESLEWLWILLGAIVAAGIAGALVILRRGRP